MIYKERMSYYDIDRRTAQMYAPIDEYLRQTKRFSQKAMKRKYNLGIGLYTFFILFMVLISGICIVNGTYGGLIITGFVIVTLGFVLSYHIKHFGETPHPDMVTCENVIDMDGMENVYTDYSHALDFTKGSIIGKYYIFIKGRTIARIKDVERTELIVREHTDEDGTTYTYHFSIHVRDEISKRVYDLETLSGNKKKREQRFAELDRFFASRQKGIDMVQL